MRITPIGMFCREITKIGYACSECKGYIWILFREILNQFLQIGYTLCQCQGSIIVTNTFQCVFFTSDLYSSWRRTGGDLRNAQGGRISSEVFSNWGDLLPQKNAQIERISSELRRMLKLRGTPQKNIQLCRIYSEVYPT